MPSLGRIVHMQEPGGGERLALALQHQRRHGLDFGCLADERKRRLADEHLAGLRRLFEAGGHVDGVTRREALLGSRHHLAGHDADPAFQPELRQRVSHLGRGAQRAERVVLARDRDAEHRHHRVADELLHRPAVALDDRLHPLEVPREQRAQPFRIDRLAERGRAGEVAEEHGDRLALQGPQAIAGASGSLASAASMSDSENSGSSSVPARNAS